MKKPTNYNPSSSIITQKAMLKPAGHYDCQAKTIYGDKGQGKTTYYYNQVAIPYNQKTGNGVLIHDVSEAPALAHLHEIDLTYLIPNKKTGKIPWQKGIVRISKLDPEQVIWVAQNILQIKNGDKLKYRVVHELVARYLTNKMVIFDEFTTYLSKEPPDWMRDNLIKHRNRDIELLYVMHSLEKTPTFFKSQITESTLFYTGGEIDPKQLKSRFVNVAGIVAAHKQLQQTSPTNNRIQPFMVVSHQRKT